MATYRQRSVWGSNELTEAQRMAEIKNTLRKEIKAHRELQELARDMKCENSLLFQGGTATGLEQALTIISNIWG